MVIEVSETASCAVASIACVISVDKPDAFTFVIAALRRGYVVEDVVEDIDVPAWEGNGDDLCGEDDEVAVPRE